MSIAVLRVFLEESLIILFGSFSTFIAFGMRIAFFIFFMLALAQGLLLGPIKLVTRIIKRLFKKGEVGGED